MRESPLPADQTPTEPTAPADAASTEKNQPAKSDSRFHRWRWVLFLLASALLALAEKLWDHVDSKDLPVPIIMGLALPLIWALVWSIAGRLVSGEFRFGEHVVLGCVALMILVASQPVFPIVYALGSPHFARASYLVIVFAASSYFVGRSLFHVLRGRGRWAIRGVSVVIGLVLAGALYATDADDDGAVVLNSGFYPGMLLFASVDPLDDVLSGELFEGAGREPAIATSTRAAAQRTSTRDAVRVTESLEIDRTEVTVREFRACVAAGACTPAIATEKCSFGAPDKDPLRDLPINCVRIEQARAFCAWAGGRLPSDAEWTAAARGTDESRPHPWGRAKPSCDRAVLDGCAKAPLPVGSARSAGRGPSGALDLSGNVSEWVDSVDEEFPATISTRGSSFQSGADEALIAQREIIAPWAAFDTIGFRCAYSVTPLSPP